MCEDKILYLGGSHQDENVCLLVSDAEKESKKEPLLRCTHEETDDRIIFHFIHGVKVGKFKRIVKASPDTDVFVRSTRNYGKLMYFGLEEFWFMIGSSTYGILVPAHEAFDILESDVIEILSALQALTGCDSISTIA